MGHAGLECGPPNEIPVELVSDHFPHVLESGLFFLELEALEEVGCC
jgi:hypothetical protein